MDTSQLSDKQLQDLILSEVTSTGAEVTALADNIPTWWLLFADKDSIAPGLRYLYVRRAASTLLWRQYKTMVDLVTGTDQVKVSGIFGNLAMLMKDIDAEIAKAEADTIIGPAGVPSLGSTTGLPTLPDSRERQLDYLLRYRGGFRG